MPRTRAYEVTLTTLDPIKVFVYAENERDATQSVLDGQLLDVGHIAEIEAEEVEC